MNNYVPFGAYRLLALLAVMVWLLPSPVLLAQAEDEDDEVITLTPFQVAASADTGYIASTAITGSRLATEIRNIPLSLEVITSDFMRDTGATDLREALRYSAGVVLESQYDGLKEPWNLHSPGGGGANVAEGQTSNPSRTTIKIRGMLTEQTLRDGFRRQHATDWINLDRAEVLRGPSALLYGVANMGGVVNYLVKRPMGREHYYGAFTIGTHDRYRGEFDYSTPFGDDRTGHNGFRVTGAAQTHGNHTDFFETEHYFVSPVFTFRPLENTYVTIDNEYGERMDRGIGFQTVRAWTGESPGSGSGPQQMRNAFITPGGIDPRTFRWSGPDTKRHEIASNHLIDIQQKITDDFWIRGGINYSRTKRDSLNVSSGHIMLMDNFRTVPGWYGQAQTPEQQQFINRLWAANPGGGTLNNTQIQNMPDGPNKDFLLGIVGRAEVDGEWVDVAHTRPAGFWWPDVLGAAPIAGFSRLPSSGEGTGSANYALINYQWARGISSDNRLQARIEGTYDLEAFNSRHSLLFGYQAMRSVSRTLNLQVYTPAAPPGPLQGLETRNWTGVENPQPIRRAHQGDGVTGTVPIVPTNRSTGGSTDHGLYGVAHSRFFEDRLTLIGGVRWDTTTGRSRTVHQQTGVETISGADGETTTKLSPQIGVSYEITPQLSVFGVYSTGVLANSGVTDGNANIFGPTEARNIEGGVKFDLLDNRISGTLSAYSIKRTNIPRFVWWAPSPGGTSGRQYDPTARQTMFVTGFDPMAAFPVRNMPEIADPNGGLPFIASFFGGIPEDPADPRRPLGTAGMAMGGIQPWSWVEHPDLPGGEGFAGDLWNIHGWGIQEGDWWMWWETWGGQANLLVDLDNPAVYTFLREGINLMADGDIGWFSWIHDPNGNVRQFADGSVGVINNFGSSFSAPVPYSDKSTGWEIQVIANPTPNWRMTMGYSRLVNRVTNDRYAWVEVDASQARFAEFGIWNFPAADWGSMGLRPEDAFEDPSDTSTGKIPPIETGGPIDDSPPHTATFWNRYAFDDFDALRGLAIGFGGQYESSRMYQAGVTPDGTGIGQRDPDTGRFIIDRLYTPSRVTVNALIEYNWRIGDRYQVRSALNVDNLFNDKDEYGFLFAPGRTARFTTSVSF